jgi:hypothetical protein
VGRKKKSWSKSSSYFRCSFEKSCEQYLASHSFSRTSQSGPNSTTRLTGEQVEGKRTVIVLTLLVLLVLVSSNFFNRFSTSNERFESSNCVCFACALIVVDRQKRSCVNSGLHRSEATYKYVHFLSSYDTSSATCRSVMGGIVLHWE